MKIRHRWFIFSAVVYALLCVNLLLVLWLEELHGANEVRCNFETFNSCIGTIRSVRVHGTTSKGLPKNRNPRNPQNVRNPLPKNRNPLKCDLG